MIYLQQESPVINLVIGEAKRLMSYSIASKLKKKNADEILEQLLNAVPEYEKKKGLKHNQDRFDCNDCISYENLYNERAKALSRYPLYSVIREWD